METCFNNLSSSLNWNVIRKKKRERKLKPKDRLIEINKKLGESQKTLLVNLPKHCKSSCENLFPLQCDLLNPMSVADNPSTKSLKPQLVGWQKKHFYSQDPLLPTDFPHHQSLAPHSYFSPHPHLTFQSWQNKTVHR